MSAPSPVATDPLWEGDWYRFARRLESPNFGARPAGTAIELIVIHSISLPPGQYGTGQVQAFFCNQLDGAAHPYFASLSGLKVSAHFFIERTGALWQFVGCGARAWHAGASGWRGRDNCNDYSIGIELEGLPAETFEDAQYETLGSLCAALGERHPITGVAGHQHIAPARKDDPGAGFDWARLQRSLGWPQDHFPHP